MTPTPLYASDNCNHAYQLHWSVTLFANQDLPQESVWRPPLTSILEQDGIRFLELQLTKPDMPQLFVSSQPHVAPADILRLVKGRWQYLLRQSIPHLWQRNYSIASVGDANHKRLEAYVAGQSDHHPMSDPRAADRLTRWKFEDPSVSLSSMRSSSHGKYLNNLHLVLRNAADLPDIREGYLAKNRDMMIAACKKKGWLLSRVSFSDNHLHALLGCGITDQPSNVALSLMNNLAFAQGMASIFKFSFYVGTFGPYDHRAIRQKLADAARP